MGLRHRRAPARLSIVGLSLAGILMLGTPYSGAEARGGGASGVGRNYSRFSGGSYRNAQTGHHYTHR